MADRHTASIGRLPERGLTQRFWDDVPFGVVWLNHLEKLTGHNRCADALARRSGQFTLADTMRWSSQANQVAFNRCWSTCHDTRQWFVVHTAANEDRLLVEVARHPVSPIPGHVDWPGIVKVWPVPAAGRGLDESAGVALFAFTQAEARLASALLRTRSLRDAASDCGVTYETGRSYLRRIFAKTGTCTQTAVLGLLQAAAEADLALTSGPRLVETPSQNDER